MGKGSGNKKKSREENVGKAQKIGRSRQYERGKGLERIRKGEGSGGQENWREENGDLGRSVDKKSSRRVKARRR